MVGEQRHPLIAGLVGLVTLEAVGLGGLFLLLLREEGTTIGLEMSPVVAGVGSALLLLVLLGGAWCTWRVWSGRWSLGTAAKPVPAAKGPSRAVPKAPPPGPPRPKAAPAAAVDLLPAPTAAELPAPEPEAPPTAPDSPPAVPGYPTAPRSKVAPEAPGETAPLPNADEPLTVKLEEPLVPKGEEPPVPEVEAPPPAEPGEPLTLQFEEPPPPPA